VGQKVKGGMYCDRCDRPVPAVKNTHRLRNAIGVVALPATAGLSAAGMKVERYICPTCGGHVHAGSASSGSLGSVAQAQMDKRERARRRKARMDALSERAAMREAKRQARREARSAASTARQPQPEATRSSGDSQ